MGVDDAGQINLASLHGILQDRRHPEFVRNVQK